MRPTRWRRSTHLLIAAAVLVAVAIVMAIAAFVTGGQPALGGTAVAATPPPATANPALVPVTDSAPEPTPAGLAAALAPALANRDLGVLGGRVTDALTGNQLWEQDATVPMQPASTNKVLTASAALLTLNLDSRVTTTVLAADQPGVVVLVGAGDPTLSSAPPGQDPLYHGAARISDLADQVRRSGVTVTSLEVDTSAFSGPPLAPGWDPADIEGGDVAPIEAAMLDGGRALPATPDSVRSPTPALDAGRALAAALDVNPQAVSMVTTPVTGRQIAAVQSATLIERLREMMNVSDNVMAECIAREVAAATHRPQSFAGAVDAVTSRLAAASIDITGATLVDSSGLSVNDRLTPETLDDAIGAAAGPNQPALRPLLDVLPVAGGSGTLTNRYVDIQTDGAAAGWLRAKTGSLTGTNALAGVVTDASGRVLTFALISNNAGPTGRTAIDNVAAALRSCGCGS
ncbi:MAG: D-alanyl-D-alanine carboxypeptidase/D-alanyl-D-alanine-endopeptidase [Mycobacteriaceae bacterium]|nr:D-alanyl-D-alanine carboxypeptidase/D-alanyl-D-alanine-endopeptidase [Mycobacteriaceae bacterium]